MKKIIALLSFYLFLTLGFSQNSIELIGKWNFNSVTTTEPNCKDVDYFPISTFNFFENGKAEFKSSEGIAKASYSLSNNIIELFDLSENGVKQEGTAEFLLKSLSETTLTLMVEYECGSINIIFKKN